MMKKKILDISPNTITSASPDSIKCICILFACSVPWTGKQGRRNKSDVFSCLWLLLCLQHFYSEYLNFYELVNKCANVCLAVQIDAPKLAYYCKKKKKKARRVGEFWECCFVSLDRCCLAGQHGRLIFDSVWCVLNVSKKMPHFGAYQGMLAQGQKA